MRMIIASLALLVGLTAPTFSETWMASKRAVLQQAPVEAEPDIVSALGSADTRALAEVNAESRKRQAEFDTRLAESGSAALASVCIGCGTKVTAAPTPRRVVTAVPRVAAAPDGETIYSKSSGFDPAQARLD